MCSRAKKYFTCIPAKDLNLYIVFKPLHVVLSLFGLFPYSVKFNKVKHEFTIVQQSIYANCLCAVSTMLFIFTFLGAHVQYLFSNNDSSLSDAMLTQMNYIVELCTLALCCIAAYVVAYTNRFNYVKILNDLSSVWIEQKNDNNKILQSLRFHIIILVMGGLLLVFVLQICVNFTRNDSIWKIILVTFSFNLPQTVQMINLAFYYTLIITVAAVLTNMKENTMKFKKEIKNIPGSFMQAEARLTCVTLRQIELAYVKVFEIKRDINEAFQAFILVTTIQCFHTIISEAFIIYHGIALKSHDNHTIINCSIWIIYQFIKIYALAYSGSLLKDKGIQIAQSLHRVSTEKLDTRALLEVQHFAMLMNYQETVLTVYGYFPLDATLMSTMIASVTMYLLILVQFD